MRELTAYNAVSPVYGSEAEHTGGSALEKCPSCDYELVGLPDNHRCPECGLVYDEHSRVWRPQRRFWLIRGTIIFGIITPIAVYHAFWGDPLSASILGGIQPGGLEWTLFVAWFLLALAVNLWMRFVYYNQYCAATLPDGLLVRCIRSKLIPWSEIGSVHGTSQMVRIRRAGGRSVALGHFFADRREMEAFEVQLSKARERYFPQRAVARL